MLKEYPATCTVPRLQKFHGRTTLEQEIESQRSCDRPLRKLLDQHRARSGNPETGIIFQTRQVLDTVAFSITWARSSVGRAMPF
jgi:hypothetical protein